MPHTPPAVTQDLKGLGFSKIGHFKEVRSKIKELEKLNIKLAQRHNRLEAILNSMTDGVTILDQHLTIMFVNRVQQKMFPDINLVGDHCYTAYYRKTAVCRNCPALKTLASRETLRGEVLVNSGAYKGHYLEWTTSPIQSPCGQVAEIVLLMRDVTARKENEFKFMQADRMAAIGFLAAGIAHEINNPLTSISGFADGLLKRLKKAAETNHPPDLTSLRDYLEIISSETCRCKGIVQNLQQFSRSSEGDYETVALDQIITATISLFRQHAKDNQIRMIFKNQFARGFNRILGKESQLKHVFLNLFNTAFKAMPHGGELILTARNDGSWIDISMVETGNAPPRDARSGIPADNATGVRPHSIENGTAIDLSICYSMVQHHNGDLKVTPASEGGTCYLLRFPANLD